MTDVAHCSVQPIERLGAETSALKRLKLPSMGADKAFGGLGITAQFWDGQKIFYGLVRKIITGWVVDQLL
jgi:hypothetical protein